MTNKIPALLGITLPLDFPSNEYNEIGYRIGNFTGLNQDHRREFLGAWQAVAYRSIACAEYDADFTKLMQLSGASPSFQELYLQEKYLFSFFINGLSILESLCYALFAIGSLIKPGNFPITTSEDKKRISPERVTTQALLGNCQ